MDKKTPANLWELHRAITLLLERTSGKSGAEMKADYEFSLIIERLFERIGETLRRIHDSDPETAAQIPNLRKAVDLRNIIAHSYYDLNWNQVRHLLDGPVPELLQIVDGLILEIPEEYQ